MNFTEKEIVVKEYNQKSRELDMKLVDAEIVKASEFADRINLYKTLESFNEKNYPSAENFDIASCNIYGTGTSFIGYSTTSPAGNADAIRVIILNSKKDSSYNFKQYVVDFDKDPNSPLHNTDISNHIQPQKPTEKTFKTSIAMLIETYEKSSRQDQDEKVIRSIAWNIIVYNRLFKKPFAREEKEVVSYKTFSEIKKENNVIEEMVSKVDFNRFMQMSSIAGGMGKFANKDLAKEKLKEWATAKYPYYVMFGKTLKLEKEIEIEISQNEIKSLVDSLMKKFPQYAFAIENIPTSDWIKNVLYEGFCDTWKRIPNVKSGMKLTTALSYLVDFNTKDVIAKTKEEFTELFGKGDKKIDSALEIVEKNIEKEKNKFIMAVSEVTQNRFIKGKAVISIDPYDYLTMSENQHNWDSCAIMNGGEYSTSGHALMLDSCTVVTYKTNNRMMEYCAETSGRRTRYNGFKFEGNSKSWRMFIFYDINTSSFIIPYSQYPEISEEMENTIKEMFVETQNSFYKDLSYTVVDKRENAYSDIIPKNRYFFNDVFSSSKKKGGGRLFIPANSNALIYFNVGVKDLKCVYCGRNIGENRGRIHCGCDR